MTCTVTPDADGIEVKEYLRRRLGFSTALIKELKLRETGIILNGERVTVRAVLRCGDTLCLDCDKELDGSPNVEPAEQDGITLLFEDDALLAFSKPSGMPTHPSRRHTRDTLANGAAFIFAERSTPFVFRPVTRLDSDVSGLVLCAKTRLAAARLSLAIASGEIKKTYLAVTDGIPAEPGGTITGYIERESGSIITRKLTDNLSGAYARTDYTVIAQNGTNALLFTSPLTGRTHQIRVSLAAAGFPVAGDGFYGNGSSAPRCMLHCLSLTLNHPLSGVPMTLYAPPYPDMRGYARERFDIDTDELGKQF